MLEARGWNCIVPNQKDMSMYVQPAIDHVKSGELTIAHAFFKVVIENLIDRGVSAVVLGCTEIPLAVTETEMYGIPVVNSIDSLVKSTLEWWQHV
jgi:aspartate racemase